MLNHLKSGITTYIVLPDTDKQVYYRNESVVYLFKGKSKAPVKIVNLNVYTNRKLAATFLANSFAEFQRLLREYLINDYAMLFGKQN